MSNIILKKLKERAEKHKEAIRAKITDGMKKNFDSLPAEEQSAVLTVFDEHLLGLIDEVLEAQGNDIQNILDEYKSLKKAVKDEDLSKKQREYTKKQFKIADIAFNDRKPSKLIKGAKTIGRMGVGKALGGVGGAAGFGVGILKGAIEEDKLLAGSFEFLEKTFDKGKEAISEYRAHKREKSQAFAERVTAHRESLRPRDHEEPEESSSQPTQNVAGGNLDGLPDLVAEVKKHTGILESHTDLLTSIDSKQKSIAMDADTTAKTQQKLLEDNRKGVFKNLENEAETARLPINSTASPAGHKSLFGSISQLKDIAGQAKDAATGVLDKASNWILGGALAKYTGKAIGSFKGFFGSLSSTLKAGIASIAGLGLGGKVLRALKAGGGMIKSAAMALPSIGKGALAGAGELISKAAGPISKVGAVSKSLGGFLVKGIPKLFSAPAQLALWGGNSLYGAYDAVKHEGDYAKSYGSSGLAAKYANVFSSLSFGLSDLIADKKTVAQTLDERADDFSKGTRLLGDYFSNGIDRVKGFLAVGGTLGTTINKAKKTLEWATSNSPKTRINSLTGKTGMLTPAPTGLGSLTAKNESGGNAGTISTGKGDAGGKSYGTYQLSSKTGTLQKFLSNTTYGKTLAGLQPGTQEFDAKWKELARTDPNFAKAQTDFIVKTHYGPAMQSLKDSGIDLSARGKAVKEAVFSTANQYGNARTIREALKGMDLSSMNDEQIISAIQDYKAAHVDSNFRSSSESVRKGVSNRIEREKGELISMARSETSPISTIGQSFSEVKTAKLEKMENEKRERLAMASGGGNGVFAPRNSITNNQSTTIQMSSDLRHGDSTYVREQERGWQIAG